MPISESIGSLPVLGLIYNYGPYAAAAFLFLINPGTGWLLMHIEARVGGTPPGNRPHYLAELWGERVFLPLCIGCAVFILQKAPVVKDGWYTHWLWHVAMLAAGVYLSYWLEKGALKGDQYTLAQEKSPAKAWHTFILPFVFYWLASAAVPVVINFTLLPIASGGVVAGLAMFIIMNLMDQAEIRKDPYAKTDAHMECEYSPEFRCFPRDAY
ncbi:MAG TPA: hypothetical protein VGP13_03750 [Candidatus Paceibacterota bacterium]|jgi:hypothetical protein|nr:hypothetical protein [Candidatus Paceibacterota bacterium]